MDQLMRLFRLMPESLVALFARVMIGLVFFRSGLTKIDGFSIKDSTFFLFANEYKLPLIPPDIAAYMGTAAELALPLALWAGLMSRFAATGLFIMTLVIQIFVYPSAYMTHGLWAIPLLLIMTFGPGKISLDYLLGIDRGAEDIV